MTRAQRLQARRRRFSMKLVAICITVGSLGVGTAAVAVGVGPGGSGPPGKTGIYKPCPHTGYTGRPCAVGHNK